MRFVLTSCLLVCTSALSISKHGSEPEVQERHKRWIPPHGGYLKPQHIFDSPEVLLSSIGGIGTTTILHELNEVTPSLHLNDENDDDRLKHMPFHFLNTSMLTNLKRIVYIHGDATHSVLSLHRRGWMQKQAMRIRSGSFKGVPGAGNMWKPSLDEFAEAEGDTYMQVEPHFESFRSQCKYPVGFLDITQKANPGVLKALAQYLHAPVSELKRVLRPWDTAADNLARYNVSSLVIQKLQTKFSTYTEKMKNLGAFHVQEAAC